MLTQSTSCQHRKHSESYVDSHGTSCQHRKHTESYVDLLYKLSTYKTYQTLCWLAVWAVNIENIPKVMLTQSTSCQHRKHTESYVDSHGTSCQHRKQLRMLCLLVVRACWFAVRTVNIENIPKVMLTHGTSSQHRKYTESFVDSRTGCQHRKHTESYVNSRYGLST